MGLRFRRTKSLGGGARLNVSKSSIGASVGAAGRSVSVGKRGVHANVGIPGTGVSYRQRLDGKTVESEASSDGQMTFVQKFISVVGMIGGYALGGYVVDGFFKRLGFAFVCGLIAVALHAWYRHSKLPAS